MKHFIGVFLFLLLIHCAPPPPTAGWTEPALGEPVSLFNGEDLTGFYTFLREQGVDNDPDGVFQVVDGMIRVSGKEWGYFGTREDYRDFYLHTEFKWGEETHEPRKTEARDSGILIHTSGPDKVFPRSIEFQIIEGGTGDIIVVDGAALTRRGERRDRGRFDRFGKGPWKDEIDYRDPIHEVEKPRGEWNTLEMWADGDTVRLHVNGELVNEGTEASDTSGKIVFQSEGAELFFRRIELRPILK